MDLRLSTPAGELTRAEQKILDYINTNTDAFLFSSIGQLAQQLELSDATVSRFARHVGCRDFKALKALVMEQASGPAVKMAGTLQQEESFSPQSWLTRQRKRPLSSSPPRSLRQRWRPSARPGRYFSTGKTPLPPWLSCFTSACGGWVSRYPCCLLAVRSYWKAFPRREQRTW